MKNKKIKKLAKLISNNLYDINYMVKTPVKSSEYEFITESSEEVFNKFEKLIKNILNYDVNIEINEDRLCLYNNSYKAIKTQKKQANEDEFLEVSINKDYFTINIGYQKRSKFKKQGVYDYFYDIFFETLKNKNNNNFEETYNMIMKESGLLRDENLDKLLE
jgi:hypothetical protein